MLIQFFYPAHGFKIHQERFSFRSTCNLFFKKRKKASLCSSTEQTPELKKVEAETKSYCSLGCRLKLAPKGSQLTHVKMSKFTALKSIFTAQ